MKRRKRWYGHIGLVLVLVAMGSACMLEQSPQLWPLPVCTLAFAVLVFAFGSARTAVTTRLARMAWHRGDRFGAATLYLGVGTLLYRPPMTPARIERNRRAVLAAQIGMPKYRDLSCVLFPPNRDDDE